MFSVDAATYARPTNTTGAAQTVGSAALNCAKNSFPTIRALRPLTEKPRAPKNVRARARRTPDSRSG